MRGGVVKRYGAPALLGLAAACIALTQLLGPSAAEAPLGRHDNGATPPLHVRAAPPSWIVTLLLAVAVICGAAVLALVMTGRWRPSAGRVVIAGGLVATALALLPPIGSADSLSYAAYGRMVATGHDPYSTTPAQLASRGDPVGAAVEVPWQHTASVYGPIATAEQAAASKLAGRDIALTVLLIDLVGLGAFLVVGLVLHCVANDDDGRLRAAVLWTANPLLWLQLVAGGHLDVLVAAFVVAAALVAGRSRLAAGALAGTAASIKAPGGLIWLALAWTHRRSRRAIASLVVGAALIAVPAYAVAGGGAVHQLSRASRLVSLATPWRPVLDVTHAPRRLIGVLALVLFVALVALLLRRWPATQRPEAVVGLMLMLGYVLAAPYALPWYDATAWALLPLVALSWRDGVLLAHTTILSLAYLPGRAAVTLHGVLHALTWNMRTVVSPALLFLALIIVVMISRRSNPAASP